MRAQCNVHTKDDQEYLWQENKMLNPFSVGLNLDVMASNETCRQASGKLS